MFWARRACVYYPAEAEAAAATLAVGRAAIKCPATRKNLISKYRTKMAPMTYAEAVGYCKSRGEGPMNNATKFATCVSSATTKNRSFLNSANKVNIRGNPVSRKSRKNRKNRRTTHRNRRN